MNIVQTFSPDFKTSSFEIKNPLYHFNIELYKVLDIDMNNIKILVKIYNQKRPIWLSVDSNTLSKLNYKLVSRAHLIDSDGIHVSSDILNNSDIEVPKGKRRCYQCEFDQFIVENNLGDEAITNGLVWKTVSNYLTLSLNNNSCILSALSGHSIHGLIFMKRVPTLLDTRPIRSTVQVKG
jgi:hypothetical protein